MRLGFVLTLVTCCLATALPCAAQESRGQVAITAFTGGLAFSDIQRRSTLDVDAGRRTNEAVSAEPTIAVGGSLAFWPRPGWGLRVQYMGARSQLAAYGETRGTEPSQPMPRYDLGLDLVAAELVFRLPLAVRNIRTFGAAGGTAARYRASVTEREGTGADAGEPLPERARFGGSVAIGARVPLRDDRLALEFEVADHFSTTPWRGDEIEGNQLEAAFSTTGVRPVRFVNQVRFSVGFRYALLAW